MKAAVAQPAEPADAAEAKKTPSIIDDFFTG